MAGPGAALLLGVWEEAGDQVPARRALTMLAALFRDTPQTELAQWPLGRRDAGLLRLREAVFGPELDAVAACPDCGTEVELHVSVAQLISADAGDGPAGVTVARGKYEISLRPVTTEDLLAQDGPPEAVEQAIVLRCITAARHAGREVDPGALPAQTLDSLGAELARTDPAATTELALDCPECGRHWLAPFHAASFVWAELNHWAGRMILDVHRLARAYGWAEDAILGMSPRRRQAYLGLVGP
ncbi:MAG: hypothetical protein WBX27_20270 [Specibacter sp.]